MVYRALILANEEFADQAIPKLESPKSDGHRLKQLLEREDVGGYSVALHCNLDSVGARHAIQEFFDEGQPDDLQLLVISGHGLKDRWSRLHFATADTSKNRLAASSLEARFVRDRMEDGRAGRKILIIDACYSGAFLDGMIPKNAGALEVTSQDFGNHASRGVSIVTASTAVQVANEHDSGDSVQSIFTKCMIDGIETGQADAHRQGVITLTDLFDYVSRRLRTEAPGQTPQCLDLSNGGTMTIARNPKFIPAKLPDELLQRINSRNRHDRFSAIEDLEFMASSGSSDAELARQALKGMSNDDSLLVRQLVESALLRSGVKTDVPPAQELNEAVQKSNIENKSKDKENNKQNEINNPDSDKNPPIDYDYHLYVAMGVLILFIIILIIINLPRNEYAMEANNAVNAADYNVVNAAENVANAADNAANAANAVAANASLY